MKVIQYLFFSYYDKIMNSCEYFEYRKLLLTYSSRTSSVFHIKPYYSVQNIVINILKVKSPPNFSHVHAQNFMFKGKLRVTRE